MPLFEKVDCTTSDRLDVFLNPFFISRPFKIVVVSETNFLCLYFSENLGANVQLHLTVFDFFRAFEGTSI